MLEAAREVLVDFQQVRDLRVTKLSEERGVRVAGERTAGFTQCFGLIVAIRIDEPQSFAGVVNCVLKLAHGGVVAVVAVGVHHTEPGRKTAAPGAVQPG